MRAGFKTPWSRGAPVSRLWAVEGGVQAYRGESQGSSSDGWFIPGNGLGS